ncbi:phage tail tape measure protein [Rodentibacter haemolyticus]|uniref:Phage tail tape measure protein n=1 Tax=Rodentibacter haemolyticus TaxID=2778911 RepID=A0ABX6UVW8_9PAST|nr:phage tail tape measure protein [Rodentibacter haemolyticus]QPB42230.1 phage tail tape measure protein [Rodentibacter haemolyticus]
MTDFATLAIKLTSDGSGKVRSDLRGIQTQAGQTEKSIESLNKVMDNLKKLLAVGLGIQGISSLIQMSDTMKSLNAQVRFVTGSVEEYNAVNKQLFDISQQTRASLEATTTLYTRSARALKDYGYSQQRILTFTETLNKAMAVGGVGAQEQASALFQLSQALGSGRLQGDEFKTIAEAAPIILDTVAEYMGKTRAEVKELASEGKITSQLLFEAITGASKRISAQFENMPLTFGQAMQQMQNATLKFVDDFGNTTGVFTALSETISLLAQNFEYLALVIGVVTLGQLGKFTQGMLSSAVGTQRQAIAFMQTSQAAKNKASSELAAAQADMRSLAASLKLAQSEQTRNVIRNQMAAQSQRIIALTNVEAVAMQRLSAAKQAASIGGRALSGAMGLLGGPAGVITIAAGALFYFHQQAKEARANALDLEAANNRLAASYEDLTAAAIGQKIAEHTEQIKKQREQVRLLNQEEKNAQGRFDHNTWLAPTEERLQKIKDDAKVAREILERDIAHQKVQFEALSKAMIKQGASYGEIEQRIKNYGVSADVLNSVLKNTTEYFNDNELALQGLQAKYDALGIKVNVADIDFKKLNMTASELNNILPQSSQKVNDLGGVFSSLTSSISNAIGNVALFKAAITGLPGDVPAISEKVQGLIKQNELDVKILKEKDPKKKAEYLAQRSVSRHEGLDEASKNALYESEYKKFLAQETLGGSKSKNSKGSKTDRFGDMYSEYTSQIAQLKAESASIAQYGGVSVYKEYDQLMEKLKTDRETFKNMTTSQIEQLKKLAKEADKANMAKQVAQYEFNKKDELDQMQFEIDLLDKTTAEQDRLNYYRKIDQEIKQLSIGMSDEYVQKLIAEGEAAKKNWEELQKLRAEKQQDPIAGLRDGFDKFGKEAENVMGNVSSVTLNALNGMSDALTNFVLTGKMDFRSFAQSVIKDITSMIIKMMIFNAIKAAGNAMGFDMSFLGGKSGGGYVDFYRGGLVGFDEGGFTGYGGKYQPAGIVHKGEYVLTKEATSRLGIEYLDYLNYQSRSKPRGFAGGGGVGVPTLPTKSYQPQPQSRIAVKVINNGEPMEAQVSQKQQNGQMEITVELMRRIAREESNNALQQNMRAGGMFAR